MPLPFFLFIDLCFFYFIPAVITQIFTSIAELVTPTEIPTKEAKSEMETHPVIAVQNSTNCFMSLTN